MGDRFPIEVGAKLRIDNGSFWDEARVSEVYIDEDGIAQVRLTYGELNELVTAEDIRAKAASGEAVRTNGRKDAWDWKHD